MFPRRPPKEYYDVKAGKYPTVEVTEEEFRQKCVASGMTPEKADFNLKICKGLGSEVLVGGEMLKVVDRGKEEGSG